MLKILCTSREELISYLKDRKGKIPHNTYLISITDPGSQQIINDEGKDNVLSLNFVEDIYGPDTLSFSSSMRIFNFVLLLKSIAEINDLDLIIQSEEGSRRSGAIAQFIYEYLSQWTHMVDTEFYLSKNLITQPSKLILNKMYAIQMLADNFIDTQHTLPQLAFNIMTKVDSKTKLNKLTSEYLEKLFKIEITRLEERKEWITLSKK